MFIIQIADSWWQPAASIIPEAHLGLVFYIGAANPTKSPDGPFLHTFQPQHIHIVPMTRLHKDTVMHYNQQYLKYHSPPGADAFCIEVFICPPIAGGATTTSLRCKARAPQPHSQTPKAISLPLFRNIAIFITFLLYWNRKGHRNNHISNNLCPMRQKF